MGASGSSEGRDSWQRAQAGVSLAPPGCLRGPGAASPVTGPQLQVEQSPGGEKAEWGQSSLLPSAKADWGVSARPHAAPRPAMGPVAAAHCLPRAGVDSSFSSEEGAAEAASSGRASSVSQYAQQVQGATRTPTDSRSHTAARSARHGLRPLVSATGTKRMKEQLPEPRRQAARQHHNQRAPGASVSAVLPAGPGAVLPGRAIKTLQKTNVNPKSTCGNTVYSCCSPYLTEAAGPRYEMPTRLKGI